MPTALSKYFQVPSLYEDAINRYQSEYVFNPRRNWGLAGEYGKLAAYNLGQQVYDPLTQPPDRVVYLRQIVNIVQSWNGHLTDSTEISKYGSPEDILAVLVDDGQRFRLGKVSLQNLNAASYMELTSYMARAAVIKSHSSYAWIPISKFLHIINPSLFPIYDDRNVWYKLMSPPSSSRQAGVFSGEYVDFCINRESRGISIPYTMKPKDMTHRFNVNYTYWARKHIVEGSPTMMSHFADWFKDLTQHAPDPYDVRSNAHTLYALAFEVIALGAGICEQV